MAEDDTPTYVEKDKDFARDMNYIPDRILAGSAPRDARDADFGGPRDVPVWPVEPGR